MSRHFYEASGQPILDSGRAARTESKIEATLTVYERQREH